MDGRNARRARGGDCGPNLPAEGVRARGFTRPKTRVQSTRAALRRAIDIEAVAAGVSRGRRQAHRQGGPSGAVDGTSGWDATGAPGPAGHRGAGATHQAQVVLAQRRVDRTTHEPHAARERLGMRPWAGAVVTADALVTQADCGRDVRKARGDYRHAVRDHPPTWLPDSEAVCVADAAVSPRPAAPA